MSTNLNCINTPVKWSNIQKRFHYNLNDVRNMTIIGSIFVEKEGMEKWQ
ncbi:hypothetical protein WMO40_13415 [Bacillaceae bacterium CLA-AA-H227]|uniref:Uncharacterized protein n=1 Tax=Robertmurraya yapensis (ex Hitch et al 2024) TaxID=3133160 RepID=A0ACC6SCE6_9BACI|nr:MULTISPECIES: hypothetical protein [Bacillales]MBD8069951.1 hypothetical protein [Bacillus sp. PS06]MBU5341518.1 hypothetical protein [Caldifermentibacillus hisashii]BDH63252.1 hypothetical protein MTP04_33820 [Lysinibacillus sp. PLM2]